MSKIVFFKLQYIIYRKTHKINKLFFFRNIKYYAFARNVYYLVNVFIKFLQVFKFDSTLQRELIGASLVYQVSKKVCAKNI